MAARNSAESARNSAGVEPVRTFEADRKVPVQVRMIEADRKVPARVHTIEV